MTSRNTRNSGGKEDESPMILPTNLGATVGSSVFTPTEQQIAERARLEAELYQQDLIHKAAALEIIRLENQRSQEKIAFLSNDSNFVHSSGPPVGDPNAASGPSAGSASNATSNERSANIIKECEKDLLKSLLKVSAPKPSFFWLQKLSDYVNYGGREYPWNFLHPRRKKEFDKFLSAKHGVSTTCEDAYNTAVYSKASECPFIKDYSDFIIKENNLNPGQYLKECAMERSSVFDGSKIKDYLNEMELTIDMFDGKGISNATAVKSLVQGLQPWAFRDFIIEDHPEIYSSRWVTAVEIITEACNIEQDIERKRNQGYGFTSKSAHTKVVKPAGGVKKDKPRPLEDVDQKPTGKADLDARSPDKTGKPSPKPDGKQIRCTNCKTIGHTVSQCEYECTRCDPPCGQRPARCPVYLKHRDILSSRVHEREKELTRAYKSNNGRASASSSSSRKSSQVGHKNLSPPKTKSPSGHRSTQRVTWKIPLTTTAMAPGPPLPDDLLIDFGCNGNFITSISKFDPCSYVPTSDKKVHLPDSSGVDCKGSGLFCGQPALLLDNFDKSLLCSEFFTDQNCAVLHLGNRLFVFKLDTSLRKIFVDLVRNSISSGHICLNVLRKNGLYSTTATTIRKIFSSPPQLLAPVSATCHNSSLPLLANISYFTTKLSTIEELVRFWHINLGHVPKDKLLTMVRNNLIDGLNAILTVDQINKHFPDNCPDCAHGNLAQKSHPSKASREYVIGNTLSIDILVAGGSKSAPILTHSGEGHAILCVDRGSGMSWVFLTKTIDKLLEFIQRMDRIYTLAGYNLKEVQVDAAFYTAEIRSYFQDRSPSPIKALVTAPHEHAQNGAAESLVKFFKNGIMKQLKTANLNMKWWGDCAHWLNDVRIRGPCTANPQMSIAEAWDGHRVDINTTPMLPFGSRVKAHIPLSQQDFGTTRCKDAIYIGRAVDHKGSILLRQLDSMRPVVRYSFKVISQNDSTPHNLPEFNIQLNDESHLPDLYYNHLTGQSSIRPVAEILQQDGSTYRAALKSQLSKNQQIYFSKINQFFIDSSSGTEYKIVGIDFQVQHQGRPSKIPKTPFFKHYDTSLHNFAPRDDGDYEWIPCSELLRDPTTTWNANKNIVSAHSAELSFSQLSRTLASDVYSEFTDYQPLLRRLSASRVSVVDIPPPKKFSDLASHPDGPDHLASFLREVDSFYKHDMFLPPDIDIKNISPDLIIQLMPL